MTTNQSSALAVLVASGRSPNRETLIEVAAGLFGVQVDPWAEWYAIPSQRPVTPQPYQLTLPRRHSAS